MNLDGFPKFTNIDVILDAVEEMIKADEIKFALTMLDNLPGYYRDNVPTRAKEIRSKLYQACMTVQDYVNDKEESVERSEAWYKAPLHEHFKLGHFSPRGTIIVDLVKRLNSEGFCVNIVELGPYNYWLPSGLKHQGCDFIYTPINVNPWMKNPVENNLTTDKPIKQIFVCFEVIEHLWNEDEIVHYFYKTQMDPDYVMISTPKYTCGGGLPNWDTRVMGHIRTWTPNELTLYCKKHWPSLNWYFCDNQMMVSIGSKEVITT